MTHRHALFLTTGTPNNEIFWRSLECVNGWKVTPHCYDGLPYERHHELIEFAKELDPDVIIKVGALDPIHRVPNPDTLSHIKDVAPFVLLCGDVSDKSWWPVLDLYKVEGCFHLIVGMDGHEYPGVISKLTPVDMRPYMQKPWEERSVFIGCNGGSGWQNEIKQRLGAVTPGVVPFNVMASFMCDCKVIVNEPKNGSGNCDHVKGRVIETGFAGACLLERKNDATARWFRPGIEYVEYADIADGVAKLQWLREHEDEAREIARCLHLRVNAEHHPIVFWGDVLARVGVDL
jgi:Glycosyl transferases group 1